MSYALSYIASLSVVVYSLVLPTGLLYLAVRAVRALEGRSRDSTEVAALDQCVRQLEERLATQAERR